MDQQMENIESSDLNIVQETASDIVNFYSGTILLTGATGFVGKLFLEKILRVCPGITRIYVIIRGKDGKNPATRLKDIFELPIFDGLRLKNKDAMKKVSIIEADLSGENLGLKNEDKEKLIKEVNYIIHCAQGPRFEENLKKDIEINIRATSDLIELAQQMKDLRVFLHFSTAFINPMEDKTEEIPYKTQMTPEKLITLAKVVSEDKIRKASLIIIGHYPSPYVFTKAVAEQLFETGKLRFPVAIVRPSLIGATYRDPIAGWSENQPENLETINDCIVGAGLGYVHVLQVKSDTLTELIPADFLISTSMVAAWKTAISSTVFYNDPAAPPDNHLKIYNVVTSLDAKINLERVFEIGRQQIAEIPSLLAIWVFFVVFTTSTWLYLILRLSLHTAPAILGDVIRKISGKSPEWQNRLSKINRTLGVFTYYASKDWKFTNNNVKKLWKGLSGWERTLFEFDMTNFDWEYYLSNTLKGYRVYVLKDPLDTIREAKQRYYYLKLAHYAMLTILGIIAFLIFNQLISFVI